MEVTTRINPPFPGNASGSDGALNKATASMDTALNKASTGLHSAVDKMAVAADDTVRNIKPAIDRVANMAHQAVNKVADAAGPTADWVRQQGDSLVATKEKMVADAGQYVSANPWKSVGVSLAAGFILSRLIFR